MQLTQRQFKKITTAVAITAPETRPNPRNPEKRDPLLGFIDENGNQQHRVTSKELFLFAAGQNLEGQIPDGLDRLTFHTFLVYTDERDFAVGLDIVPTRVYRSNVIPVSQKDVETVQVRIYVGGQVRRVTRRPSAVTPANMLSIMRHLNRLATEGVELQAGVVLGTAGVIESVGLDVIEIRPNTTTTSSRPVYDLGLEPKED